MKKLELPKDLFDQDKQTEEPKESVSPLHVSVLKMSYELVKMSAELVEMKRQIECLQNEIDNMTVRKLQIKSCITNLETSLRKEAYMLTYTKYYDYDSPRGEEEIDIYVIPKTLTCGLSTESQISYLRWLTGKKIPSNEICLSDRKLADILIKFFKELREVENYDDIKINLMIDDESEEKPDKDNEIIPPYITEDGEVLPF